MNITVHTADLSDIEEKASDLAGAIASIKAIAVSNPEHVTTLLTTLEMAVQSVQTDLYQLRTLGEAKGGRC
jgi:hypothetical protein